MTRAFLIAAALCAALPATSLTQTASIEAAKSGSLKAFEAAVPLRVQGAASVSCEARLRWTGGGFGGRCSRGVVTGVRLLGGQLTVDCAEIDVYCR